MSQAGRNIETYLNHLGLREQYADLQKIVCYTNTSNNPNSERMNENNQDGHKDV